jgi:hypothetical protein
MLILGMELASCHSSGTWNFEMAARFMLDLCTPGYDPSQSVVTGSSNQLLDCSSHNVICITTRTSLLDYKWDCMTQASTTV